MTAAEILEAIIAAAVKYGPSAVELVEKVVEDVKADHPQLGSAPPEDGEASIDASIDAQLAKQVTP